MNMQFTYSLNRLYDNSTLIGQLLQDNTYKYDNAGNIISIDDNGLNTRNQYFEYDNLNRLIYSMGDMNCQGTGIGYETDYTYSIAGRLLKKNVTSQRMSTTVGVYPVDYRNSYAYPSSGNTFAVRSVQDALSGSVNNFDWDANGNLIRSVCGSPVHDRHLCWTEDSRLQGYWELSDNDGGIAAYYGYAAGGDRNYKLTSPRIHASQNASNLMQHPTLIYPTLYASSIITFHKGGYTKHYFEGANRVCSKIGGGFHHVHWGNIEDRVPALAEDYDQQSEGQREGVERAFNECLGMGVDLDGIIDLYDVVKHEAERDDPEPAFHYHSDHLGSAAYLTNDAGQVTQTLNYLPYGEDWVDIQNYAETRYPRLGIYAYNGKERDYESGFHYYGTRYYWSEVLTGWLSVDPMMDKYPWISPYNYCVWNSLIMVDPDGCMVDWVESADGIIYWDDNTTSPKTTKAGEKYLGKNVLVATHGRDENLKEDINGATFELYIESDHSGPVATIRGNTISCDIDLYGTLPEGLYAADEKTFKNHPALLITSLETGSRNLKTVKGNPNNSENYYDPDTKKKMKPINEHIMSGIYFHRGNIGREALKTSKGIPISEGCQTGLHGNGSNLVYDKFASHFSGFHGTYYLRSKPTGSITPKCILK